MKSINKIITAVIGIMLMSAVSGYAYSDSTFSELKINSADGFYTVLTDTEGDIHTYNGIISAKDIESSDEVEKIESYTVYSGDEKIIDTKLNDIVSRNTVDLFNEEGKIITNGYYSVKFEIDDNNEVFLTGLSDSNIDMVQDKLIKSKLNGEGLELESFDFIDAEKTNLPNDGDDELCWAASTSNILHYTGWGKKVGFDSTDDIFDDFRDNFTDVGGNTYYGIEWFFNGMYRVQGVDGWAQAKNYGSNGKYLKQYSANDVFEYIDFSNNHKNFNNAATALENGCGLSLNLGWLDNDDNRTGGHAISLWGYVCDKNLENDNSEYYKAIIVSDSDSDEQADENRRLAPNKLNVLNIKPYQTESLDSWKLCNYSDGLIENVIALKPYNDNIEYETDESATLDKFADYDFTVSDINMSNDELDSNANINKFSTNDNIYINPIFSNPSLKSFDGTLDYSITLTDKADNSEKGSWSGTYSGKIKSFETSDILNAEKIKIEKLPVGEYTVAVTVNSDKTVGEAYYYNNTKTSDFSVVDKSYDVSDVVMNVNIDEFEYGIASATFTYDGLDTATIPSDASYHLMESYYSDGKWNMWDSAYVADEQGLLTPPKECNVYTNGEKVKYRLVIESKDTPYINIYSDEYELKYTKIGIVADETNTGNYTRLERGATTLADGEKIAFKIKNISTYANETPICAVKVCLMQEGTEIEMFNKENISLAYGESTDTISIDSWTNEDLSGKYEIIAVAESDYGSDEINLGTIEVKEKPLFVVTTSSDTEDEYDGIISLREAVKYIKEFGNSEDEITFDDDIDTVYLNSPIIIDSDVKIKGKYSESNSEPLIIQGSQKAQLFNVTQNGSLDCEIVSFYSGLSKIYGGAIENKGGNVSLQNCLVLSNKSGSAGGGIYSDGGNVKLLNCVFSENTSGYGGAVYVAGGARLDMLNCTLFENSSNSGAFYNNGGQANIIYSTFNNNTATSSGGGAVTDNGKTNLIGSIASNNGETDIDGKVNVYGSFVTSVSDGVNIDDLTIKGSAYKIFVCSPQNQTNWYYDKTSYKTELSPFINEGVYVKNSDGKIAYSSDGTKWNVTDISSAFTDDDYKKDTLGNTHERLFGSVNETYEDGRLVSVEDDRAYVYVPKAQNAVFIEKDMTRDGVLNGVHMYEISLDVGTNVINLDENDSDSDLKDYMVWNNLENMCSIIVNR